MVPGGVIALFVSRGSVPLEAQEIEMEVFALLFASKYGMAALGSVTLAAGMLVSTFWVLTQKASRPPAQIGR